MQAFRMELMCRPCGHWNPERKKKKLPKRTLKWATTGTSAPKTSFYVFFPENITVVRSNARSGSFSRMKTKIYRNFCLSLCLRESACLYSSFSLHCIGISIDLCVLSLLSLFFPPRSSLTPVLLHTYCRFLFFFGFGLSRSFSPSIPASMRLCPTSDSSSTRINFLKPHLILLHTTHALTRSVMDLLHWAESLIWF